VLCFCQRGGLLFMLCELNFSTAVLPSMLLQHTHLRIYQEIDWYWHTSKQEASFHKSFFTKLKVTWFYSIWFTLWRDD
jgi:hypothetical protein